MTIKTRDSDRLARAASRHAAGAVQRFLSGHCDSAGIGAVVRVSSQLRRCGTCRPGPGGFKCSTSCCWRQLDMLDQSCAAFNRQFPEVYGFCHTFLHVAQVKKHTDMREWHVRVWACDSRISVYFLTRATCKNVRQNLIPRATA